MVAPTEAERDLITGRRIFCVVNSRAGKGTLMEKGPANPEIKEEVLAYLDTVQKAKSRDIASAIKEKKMDVDLAVKELSLEDRVEYLYLTTTFVALKGKVGPPD
jgi:hypothetical protein